MGFLTDVVSEIRGAMTQPKDDSKERREGKKGRSAYENIRGIKNLYEKAQKYLKYAQFLTSPMGIFTIIIVVVMIALISNGGGGIALDGSNNSPTPGPAGPPTVPPVPGVTIELTVPPEFPNGANVVFTATVSYNVDIATTPIDNIEIVGVPSNSTYSSSTIDPLENTGSQAIWTLESINGKTYTITLKPSSNDVLVSLNLFARAKSGVSQGGTSPQEFRDLTAGEGRNTTILGDRSTFVSTIMLRSSGLPLTGKESYLGQLYDAAIAANVNPMIMAIMWGVESSFSTSLTYPFGCLLDTATGFAGNVECAANTLDYHMGIFDTQNSAGSLEIPSQIGNTCIYTDAFDYAYEKYTPVCAITHGNDPERANFITFYKKFKGL